MATHRILVLFGTSYGQTARIAHRIAELLTAAGDAVALENALDITRPLDPGAYDGVIVGASVRFGRHQRSVRRFVRANRDRLNAMTSAFFSVSGAAAGQDEESRRQAQGYLDRFLRQAGWRPTMVASIAGATAYTRYGPFVRWMIRRISERTGGPTDTGRDHEFTDWAQVERFAVDFVARLPRPAPRPLAPASASRASTD